MMMMMRMGEVPQACGWYQDGNSGHGAKLSVVAYWGKQYHRECPSPNLS